MENKEIILQVMYETAGILPTLNMWEDIFCGKQTPVVFMTPDSQFGLKAG